MVKVVVFNGQFKITIPKDLTESKGWKAGTKLRFIENPHGDLILKEIK
ncbi:MAG: hypothetical protein GY861_09070 [bacterium]|nr:hypothetical protein [bacterium]